MKCPQCDHDILLTWKRYTKTPLGRMSCPSCHAKLVCTHRWFYWPLMILGCCILGVPLAILGAKYGVTGAMVGWFIGAFGFGIPFDRFLEMRFSVLTIRRDETSNKPAISEVQ
ncbi:MAG TPA: hypothetical protein VLZ03_05790 [Thermodesulfobacteriota bacterium]|nr:hypothetical protein [Thermodesulfobacteriota bacterium]